MDNSRAVAWVLNLDAEEELAHAGRHTPRTATEKMAKSLVPKLVGEGLLVAPGDVLVWPRVQSVTFQPSIGRAWCPTPWALNRLAQAGITPEPSPSVDVLRRVNHRQFASQLESGLPGAGFASDEHMVHALMANTSAMECASEDKSWLLKRAFGFAGKGRRKVRAGALSDEDARWIVASLSSGDGLQVEPWVTRVADFALHGWVTTGGQVTWGELTGQEVDSAGAWIRTRVAPPFALTSEESRALETSARLTAQALHGAGYFGPFGIDAFRWRAPDGTFHFQARSEINARYSMGWSAGMAAWLAARRRGEAI